MIERIMGGSGSTRSLNAGKLFNALFARSERGYATLWRRERSRACLTEWYDLSEPNTISRMIEDMLADDARECDVYVSTCVSGVKRGQHERIRQEDVISVPAFFMDIDTKLDPTKGDKRVPTDPPSAQDALDILPIPPSMTICSGNGLHAYWIFEHPLPVKDTNKLTEIMKGFAKGVQDMLGEDFAGIDSHASEPARVLRVDGTHNHKENHAKPVTVYSDTGIRYTFDQLMPYVKEISEPRKAHDRAARSLASPAYIAAPAHISDSEIQNRVRTACQYFNKTSPKVEHGISAPVLLFRRFYRGDTSNEGYDDSRADFALMLQLWLLMDGEPGTVRRAFELSKLYRPDRGEKYLSRTLGRAEEEAQRLCLVPFDWSSWKDFTKSKASNA